MDEKPNWQHPAYEEWNYRRLLSEACTEIARCKVEIQKLEERIEKYKEQLAAVDKRSGVVRLPFSGSIK